MPFEETPPAEFKCMPYQIHTEGLLWSRLFQISQVCAPVPFPPPPLSSTLTRAPAADARRVLCPVAVEKPPCSAMLQEALQLTLQPAADTVSSTMVPHPQRHAEQLLSQHCSWIFFWSDSGPVLVLLLMEHLEETEQTVEYYPVGLSIRIIFLHCFLLIVNLMYWIMTIILEPPQHNWTNWNENLPNDELRKYERNGKRDLMWKCVLQNSFSTKDNRSY